MPHSWCCLAAGGVLSGSAAARGPTLPAACCLAALGAQLPAAGSMSHQLLPAAAVNTVKLFQALKSGAPHAGVDNQGCGTA